METSVVKSFPVKFVGGLIFVAVVGIILYLGGVLSVYVLGLVVSWIVAIFTLPAGRPAAYRRPPVVGGAAPRRARRTAVGPWDGPGPATPGAT